MSEKNIHEREDKLDATELDRKKIAEKIGVTEDGYQSETVSKLSNFWYYNKWKVIISIGVIILLCVTTVQMCSNTENDVTVLYAGSCYPTKDELSAIDNMLSLYLPGDYNGDGDKLAGLNPISLYSNEEVEEIKEKAKTDSTLSSVDGEYNSEQLMNFDAIILAGEYSVCIIQEWLYERVSDAGGFRLISDVLGYEPENCIGSEAIYLSDTAIYKDNPGLFDSFPEDTVICLRTESQIGKLFGKKGNSKEYEFAEEYFKNLVLGPNS